MSDEVHQIGRIFTVVDRERRVEPDLVGILAQQPGADPVKSACPRQSGCRGHAGIGFESAADDTFDPSGHLGCGAPCEGHQQQPAWVRSIENKMSHTVRERVRFA
jgi:hypothetical protein